MKKILFGMIISLAIAGCSGMQATPKMETMIAENASVATIQLSVDQPVEIAKTGLDKNAVIFTTYYDAATINIFAYWFDAKKQIWCNAKYYRLLNRNRVAAGIFNQNAMGGLYEDGVIKDLFREECKWLTQVNDAVSGSEVQR